MWFFVESVPGSEVWPAQHPLLLFPYPQTTYSPTHPENVVFCGKCTRYRNPRSQPQNLHKLVKSAWHRDLPGTAILPYSYS